VLLTSSSSIAIIAIGAATFGSKERKIVNTSIVFDEINIYTNRFVHR